MGHWDARKGRLRLHACGESDTGAALGKWCQLVVKMRSKHCVWPVCHTVGFPTPRGLGIKTLGSDRSRVKWRRIISADVLAFVTKTWSVFGAAPLKKKKNMNVQLCLRVSQFLPSVVEGYRHISLQGHQNTALFCPPTKYSLTDGHCTTAERLSDTIAFTIACHLGL